MNDVGTLFYAAIGFGRHTGGVLLRKAEIFVLVMHRGKHPVLRVAIQP